MIENPRYKNIHNPQFDDPLMINKNYQQYRQAIDNLYLKSIHELEKYSYYILRCLDKVNINVKPSDFILLTQERKNGTIAQAIVYPRESIVDGVGVVNPMFFYGFKWDYTEDYNVEVVFTEDYEELIE